MNLVSYAQNQEDIMLYRALRGVSKGFYIDVGAQQPVVDSVTKLFYERGWTGINIDPLPQWFQMLEADRPHDVNLQIALAEKSGRMAFFAIPGTGLSTADPEFVKRHSKAGYAAEEIDVEVRTLDEVCAEYGVDQIHFLKIDVEGAEEGVIRGFSFDRIRPWILVVEAVEPVAQREGDDAQEAVTTHSSWEPLLLAHGYEFVYWDGLNRFYLAKEHFDLRSNFDAPPNPLDAFVRHSELVKNARILQLEGERRDLTDAAQLVAARRELGDIHGLMETAQNRLTRIAELEQDNARLIGRMSALDENQALLQAINEQLRIALQRSNGLREECDRLTVERDHLIAERDHLIAARDRPIVEREELVAARDQLIVERDYLIAVRDQLIVERDCLMVARDQLITERDHLIVDRDQLIAERDNLTAERARLITERDRCAERMRVILHSRSWRLTKPFRWIVRKFSGAKSSQYFGDDRPTRSLPRRAIRCVLFAGLRFVQRHDSARRMTERALGHAPILRGRLSAFARHNAPSISPYDAEEVGIQTPDIARVSQSPGVLEIYTRIRSMSLLSNSRDV
ncbi:FkbM family methyltransferase [Dyella sp. RRB7]|uniref:FkbM family methyltransferase n=1 Tax=Dyella sp. RRB7 TaxID=2919502 RepID=UPI001FAA90D1|nr:FkbM family methyltransferase [Dyella sp. RRB7]